VPRKIEKGHGRASARVPSTRPQATSAVANRASKTDRAPVAANDGEPDALFVTALARGLDVLAAFGASDSGEGRWRPVGVRELAARTGLTVPAVQRATHTLERCGYLRKDAASGRFVLSARTLNFGYAYLQSSPFFAAALPLLVELRDEIGETVNVSVLDGCDMVIALRVPSARRINPISLIGRRMPAFATATGRATLAFSATDIQESALAADVLQPLTRFTVVERGQLKKLLQSAQRDGFATVDQDGALAERALAAPIIDGRGTVVAALGVSVSTSDWTLEKMRSELAPRIIRAAQAMSRSVSGWSDIVT
jgi:IclR family transcriptional regulator, pca regulon regulatory protein